MNTGVAPFGAVRHSDANRLKEGVVDSRFGQALQYAVRALSALAKRTGDFRFADIFSSLVVIENGRAFCPAGNPASSGVSRGAPEVAIHPR